MDKTVKVAGYDKHGEVREFDLKPGEKLPAGYTDAPPKGRHPADVAQGIKPDAPADQRNQQSSGQTSATKNVA